MRCFLIYLILACPLISLSEMQVSVDNSKLVYRTEIRKKNIHTVQMFPANWNLGEAIIELKGNNQLLFSFDELDALPQNYSYRILHCNKNWQSSELSLFDYLEGFSENPITDYEHSFNTNTNYIHYRLKLPNKDVKFKLSGNYILEVFEDFNPEKIVIRQRFMIVNPKVNIQGSVKHPVSATKRDTHQEVEFRIMHPNFTIDNPRFDLSVILTQNNRFDGTEREVKPVFIRKNELVFDDDNASLFPGGNEFRHFDLKSLRYQTRFISKIEKDEETTNAFLTWGYNRHFAPYVFKGDLNGNYIVEVQERDHAATEADYVHVTFTLLCDQIIKHSDFYVHGKFNNWQCNQRNKMNYDFEKKAYVATIFMKQGYYDYQFAWLDRNTKIPDLGYIEGNHWETENNYGVYVYYCDIALNCDLLIAYQLIPVKFN